MNEAVDTVTSVVVLTPQYVIQPKRDNVPSITLSAPISLYSQEDKDETIYHIYKDASTRFTGNDGWCMLTGVQGAWGSEESAMLYLENGNWVASLKRGNNVILVTFQAVMITPVDL